MFAVVHAFDYASTISKTINDIFLRAIPITIYTDSKSLYDGISGINSTTEKRLLIDLEILRQAYELREIAKVAWIPSADNPADALTKDTNPSPALMNLMMTNPLSLKKKSWVERNDCGLIPTSNDGMDMENNVRNDMGNKSAMISNAVHDMGCLTENDYDDVMGDSHIMKKTDHENCDDMAKDLLCKQNVLVEDSKEKEEELPTMMCI